MKLWEFPVIWGKYEPAHWPSVRQWSGRPGFNPRSRHTKDFKMVLDTSLLNTQWYKVRIKGKVEQSRYRSSALPYTSGYILLKREPSGRPRLRSPTTLAFWLSCLAFMSDGASNNSRFEAERPPTSVGPPSGGRAATFVPYV